MSTDLICQLFTGAIILLAVFLLFSLSRKIGSLITFIFLVLYCLKESVIGVLQLLGHCVSDSYLYKITGSFNNPGPYGGFLSVCTCLLIAYLIEKKVKINNDNLSKLSYYLVLFITIISLSIIPLTQSRSAIIGLGCGLLTLFFINKATRRKAIDYFHKYGFCSFIIAALLIVGAYLYKKPSADGRLFMDKICIKAMCENGWKGAGMGQFGRAYGEAQAQYFINQIEEKGLFDLDWTAINEHDRLIADCPNNAFNEYLFIGVEAGPISMLLFMGLIVSAIVFSIKRETIWCYGLIVFSVFALFSYPLHVKQLQIIFIVIVTACFADKKEDARGCLNGLNIRTRNDNWRKMVNYVIAVSISIFSILLIIKSPQIRLQKNAKQAWKKAEYWHHIGYHDYVVEDCDSLLPYLKNDYRFLFAYGQSLNKTGRYEKSDSVLKIGTTISSDPMFWNVMGNNSLALGRYREAEERYKRAFYMVPNRLYPLHLLTNLYYTEHDSVNLLKMANIVNNFIPKIESENTAQLRDLTNNLVFREP